MKETCAQQSAQQSKLGVGIYKTSTNLQKLILCGIGELFMKCVLQHFGNETHAVAAEE